MPSATGQNWEKYQKKFADDEVEEKKITPLSDEYVFGLKNILTTSITDRRAGTFKYSRPTTQHPMPQL
jgi:hypothetical protein